ncbi:hypothetical protein [Pseudoalteromonas rubra]|uniref:Lipocalin-like domain-containing protein n=1 Tax=Pseudoalteromonas rubra TaxID=43658 RepID=A0A5S3X2D4_9GAMM|nr:hypothetical protein [Pseudoalteromonas rubra]TMP38558.1 hypothetical protein CWB98_05130 [Pseudoalteromonas rubra]
MSVRFILPVLLILSGCQTVGVDVPLTSKLLGVWTMTYDGSNLRTTQVCEFFENAQRTCIVEEASFSAGFGEAHRNKITGTWRLEGEMLTVTETLNFSSVEHQVQFKVKSTTANQFVLVSERGDVTTWHRVER